MSYGYQVTYCGSDDPATNDDAYYGADCETWEGATFAFLARVPNPSHTPSHRVAHVFLEKVTGRTGYDVEIEVLADRPNPDHDAARCARESKVDDRAWQSERAMQAGMAFGCDGYNDVMGY